MHELLNDHHRVIVFPSHSTTAPHHNVPLRRPFNFVWTGIWNMMHTPATQVPMGLDRDGLPLGVQVVGGVGNDVLCIGAALALEKEVGGGVPPPIVKWEVHKQGS